MLCLSIFSSSQNDQVSILFIAAHLLLSHRKWPQNLYAAYVIHSLHPLHPIPKHSTSCPTAALTVKGIEGGNGVFPARSSRKHKTKSNQLPPRPILVAFHPHPLKDPWALGLQGIAVPLKLVKIKLNTIELFSLCMHHLVYSLVLSNTL